MNDATPSTSIVLTADEIRAITGRQRHQAQAMALARMGITFLLRADGSPVVSRAHFEQHTGHLSSRNRPDSFTVTEPNWKALDAAEANAH